MKKRVCLFLALCGSLLSSEELQKDPIAAALPDTAVQIEDPAVSFSKLGNNGLYFLVPIGGLKTLSLQGLAFRRYMGNRFFEASYYREKYGDITYTRYRGSERFTYEILGTIHQNVLGASYGFKLNIPYGAPYISFGAAAYLPYIQYEGRGSLRLLPTLSTALGLDFRYGFIDLMIHYLPLKWKYRFQYKEPGYEENVTHSISVLGNFRLGVGYPF